MFDLCTSLNLLDWVKSSNIEIVLISIFLFVGFCHDLSQEEK